MRFRTFALLSIVLLACASDARPAPRPRPAPTPPSAPPADASFPPEEDIVTTDDEDPPPTPRVLLVVVDGLRADMAASMPAWKALARDGAWSLEARTAKLPITVVSFAVILTGVGPDTNGVKKFEPGKGTDLGAWRPLKVKDTLFTAAQANGLRGAGIIRKKKLNGLMPKEAVDDYALASSDDAAVEKACALLEADLEPRLILVHLAEPDAVGHSIGWKTKEQEAAVVRTSDRLAELRTCLDLAEVAWRQPTYMLVTADHGGHKRTHGKDVDTDRLVPWVLVGPGVAVGQELTGVRLLDTAKVVLAVLGIPDAIPGLEGAIPTGLFDP